MSEEHAEPLAGDVEDDGILDDLLGIEPDEPEAEVEDQDQAPPDDGVQAPQPSRASRRVVALHKRLKDQEDENRRLRSDIDRIIAQTRQPVAPQIDPYRQAELNRLEQERLAMMQPHEVAAYTEQKLRNEFNQRLQNDQRLTLNMIDRQTFELLKARDPDAARYADRIETILHNSGQGGIINREVILNALVGEEARAGRVKREAALRRRGARQIAAQTVQPGGGRSTAAAPASRRGGGDSDEAFMERLRNTTVGDAW